MISFSLDGLVVLRCGIPHQEPYSVSTSLYSCEYGSSITRYGASATQFFGTEHNRP